MLNKLKENIPLIIVIVILTISGISGLKTYKKQEDYRYNGMKKTYEKCKIENSTTFPCDRYEEPPIRRDTISTFTYVLRDEQLSYLQIFAPFLVIFISIFGFHKKIRKGFLKNNLTRISYKKFMKREYIKTIKKYSIVYPIFLLIMFIACYTYSGHFEYEKSVLLYNTPFDIEVASRWYIFLPSYLLDFVFNSVFWMNIGIYNCKNNKKALPAIVISYIEYIMIFAIFEFAFEGGIFYGTRLQEMFGLANVYAFRNITLLEMNLFTFSLAAISTFIVYLSYRNKEKVLIEVGLYCKFCYQISAIS